MRFDYILFITDGIERRDVADIILVDRSFLCIAERDEQITLDQSFMIKRISTVLLFNL